MIQQQNKDTYTPSCIPVYFVFQTPTMRGEMLFLAALHATFFASTQVKAQKRERGIFLIVQLLQVKRSYFWSDSCRVAPYVHHYDTLEKRAMTYFKEPVD